MSSEVRCAWVDPFHDGINMLFPLPLKAEYGIHLDSAGTIEAFCEQFDITKYSCMLYHPGIKHQAGFGEVVSKFPHLNIALITSSGSESQYNRVENGTQILSYDSTDAIVEFIRGNQ